MEACFQRYFFRSELKKGTEEEMLGGFYLRTTVTTTFTVFLNFCRNLCSIKRLKPKHSLVSNFILIGSCIERTRKTFNFYEAQ